MGTSISPYLSGPFSERRADRLRAVGRVASNVPVARHTVLESHYIDAVAVELLPSIATPATPRGHPCGSALALYTAISQHNERVALGIHITV